MGTIEIKRGDMFFKVVIVLIITLLVAVLINDCSGDVIPKQPEVVYKYKTDTIFIDEDYQDRYYELVKEVDKWKKAPPKTIIKWKEPDLKYVTIDKVPDSILVIIDSLKYRLAIHDNYIKMFPKNPKLIDLSLTKDTLGLNLLNVDGRVTSYIYPIYLDRFDYKWLEGNLKYTRTSTKTIKQKNNNFKNLYFNTGYDIVRETPEIGVEYFFNINRFKFEASTGIQLKDVNAEVKIGYRLLK